MFFLTGLGLVGGRGGVGLEGAEAESGIISMRPGRTTKSQCLAV